VESQVSAINAVLRTTERNSEPIGERLEQTTAALRERDAFVRLPLDSTAEAILGTDLQGNCTFCNAASLRMLAMFLQKNSWERACTSSSIIPARTASRMRKRIA
jgi:sensor histidine kinase regulating citrate/malate metabolism